MKGVDWLAILSLPYKYERNSAKKMITSRERRNSTRNWFPALISSGFKGDEFESQFIVDSLERISKSFRVEEKGLSACPVLFMY